MKLLFDQTTAAFCRDYNALDISERKKMWRQLRAMANNLATEVAR